MFWSRFAPTLGAALIATCTAFAGESAISTQSSEQDQVLPVSEGENLPKTPSSSQALGTLETPATHALVMEANTGTVLMEKNANQPMYPSSMTKIMTVYYALAQVKQGARKLTETFVISENAYKTEGSRMFAELGEHVSIENLLKGAIIQSGNDACVALAEGFHANERIFAEKMTQMAHDMGAKDTCFINSSGLPDPQHVTTPHDLAIISKRLIQDFPEEYKLFAQTEFTHNNIKQGNRNPLLYKNMGADGIKTGHTEKAGYGMVASVLQGDRRIIVVVNGLNSMNERSTELQRLINWAIKEYDSVTIANAGQHVDHVDVAGGVEDTVSLVVKNPIYITLPRNHKSQVSAHLVYKKPLLAPIDPQVSAAKLILKVPGKADEAFDLYPEKAIGTAGFFKRIKSTFGRIIYGSNVGKT